MEVMAEATGGAERAGDMEAAGVNGGSITAAAGVTAEDIMAAAGVTPAMAPAWLALRLAGLSSARPSQIPIAVINTIPVMTPGAILLDTPQASEPAIEFGLGVNDS